MTSDYPGAGHPADPGGELPRNLAADGLRADDFGPAGPGLDQLLRTLTAEPTGDELAGEQAALSMFRANVQSSAPSSSPSAAPWAAPAVASSSAAAPSWPPAAAETRQLRQVRPPARRLQLVAAATVALVGGFAAAAYAAVLPAPIQHVAYQALHFIGVPDVQHGQTGRGHQGSSAGGPGSSGRSHAKTATAGRSGSTGATGSAPGSPNPSASASGSAALALSVQAVASQIPAGSAATIDGQLSSGAAPLAGVTVSLLDRTVGQLTWHLAGQASTSAQGGVTISIASLTTNTRFLLIGSDGARSPMIWVTVVPYLTTTIQMGPKDIDDYLTCTSLYANGGDPAVLQVLVDGVWVSSQAHTLNAAGDVVFAFGAHRLAGDEVRVVLLATLRHARAISVPSTVPTPG